MGVAKKKKERKLSFKVHQNNRGLLNLLSRGPVASKAASVSSPYFRQPTGRFGAA